MSEVKQFLELLFREFKILADLELPFGETKFPLPRPLFFSTSFHPWNTTNTKLEKKPRTPIFALTRSRQDMGDGR
jgi:hypothetical protein